MYRKQGKNLTIYPAVVRSAIVCCSMMAVVCSVAAPAEAFSWKSSSRMMMSRMPNHCVPHRHKAIPRSSIRTSHIVGKASTQLRVVPDNSEGNEVDDGSVGGVLELIGLVSQPIVWISLYSLATTGHGLPAGPGGSIGAVEGIAYLVVVGSALSPTMSSGGKSLTDTLDAKILSRATIALGLLVLAGVAAGKGCVPNAKPILDYSAYLPVCGPEQ